MPALLQRITTHLFTVVVDPADYGRVLMRCASATVTTRASPAAGFASMKQRPHTMVLLPHTFSGVAEAEQVNSQRLCW